MTATEIRPIHPAPSRLGQATAVEQSRAVAEVEAAIVVAMRHPRNVPAAIEAMRETCRRKELADRAFFRYSRGGSPVTGPTVHLARELARVWGNIQYGLSELRRDDEYGQSEMLAFAWDVQTNARCSSVIINPHRGYTGGRELTELRDIYENNANVGSRRVREAIFAVLPAWFTEEAKDICAKTIADGGGVPLPQRIANAIEVFGNLGITIPQLEAKLGLPTARWTDQDVAQLRVIRQSLLRGEISKDDEFPAAQQRVTADEITGNGYDPSGPAPTGSPAGQEPAAGSEAPRRPQPAGKQAVGKLTGILRALELGTDEDVAALLEWQCGEPYAGTRSQVQLVTSFLEDHLAACQGDTAEAASAIWAQFRAVTEQDAAEDPEAS
jgi:hypothetical protein